MATTWLAFGCTHYPMVDPDFKAVRMDAIARLRPQVIVNLGDFFDYTALCSKPTDERHSLADEFARGAMDYDEMKAASPGSKHVFLMGNHEERFLRAGVDNRLKDLFDFRRHGSWQRHGDVQVIMYGARDKYCLGPVTITFKNTGKKACQLPDALDWPHEFRC